MTYLPPLAYSLVIAFALRLLWAVIIPVIPISDSAAYDTFATNIWLHGTYGWEPDKPYSYWPVGTAGIYSFLYSIFGHNYWPIVALNIIASLIIIFCAYRLTSKFFKSENIAKLTAFTLAIWPSGIFFVTVLNSELLYMMFSMLGFWLFFKTNKSIFTYGLLIGLCFAAAYYVRPMILVPFILCIFVSIVREKQNILNTSIKSAVVLLVIVVCVAPWAHRNYQLHNAFVPMSTNSGAVFWMGNQPGTTGGYLPTPPEMRDMDTHQRSQILKQEAIEYIKEDPVAFVSRSAYKFVKFHSYETIAVTWNEKGISKVMNESFVFVFKLITQAYWLVFMLLAWLGLILYLAREGFWQAATHPFTLFWASSAAIHSLIVSQDRYHIPSVPFLFAFSSFALLMIWSKLQKGSSDETPKPD